MADQKNRTLFIQPNVKMPTIKIKLEVNATLGCALPLQSQQEITNKESVCVLLQRIASKLFPAEGTFGKMLFLRKLR